MVIYTVKFDTFYILLNLYMQKIFIFSSHTVAHCKIAHKDMQVLKCSSDKLTAKINLTSRR